jgi:hypothetical protein
MHAVVVQASWSGDDSESLQTLREEIVPRVSQAPGFVAGYWVRLESEHGTAVIVLDSEENARNAKEQFQPPEGVTLDSVEVGEVVANA